MDIEGTYFNIIKAMCGKPMVNIFNGGNLKAFSLRSGRRQGCPLPRILFSSVLEVQGTAVRQKKKRNKRHPDWNGRSKTLFADYLILYIENPEDSTKKL